MFAARLKVIGAKIAYYRKLKDLTQLALADSIGISEDYLSRLENGKAPGVSLTLCMKLAEALGVTLEDLTKDSTNINS